MDTPRVRPRGDESLKTRLGRADDNTDLLSRRINKRNRTLATTPTGGVIGTAEVDSFTSTVLHDSSGLDRYNITYDAPYDFDTPDIMRASEFCTVNNNEIHLTPGTYTISVRVDYGWPAGTAGVPSGIQLAVTNMGASSDAPTGGYDMFLPTIVRSADAGTSAGVTGISQWTPPMPTIVSDGDWFWLEMTCYQPLPIGTPVTGVNGDPGLHWTIWKWT